MDLIEKILDRGNMGEALRRVVKNDGAAGVDGMRASELPDYCKVHWGEIKALILSGKYKPQAVRRVEIRKEGGGTRLLGIPTVLDRMIQQARECSKKCVKLKILNLYAYVKEREV